MNINDPRIEQYLDNVLPETELKAFLKELDEYPEVKEYVQFKQFVIEGIQSEGKEELKEYIRSRVQDESSDSQTNLWLYSVATVTLMLVSYFFINQYIRTGSLKEATEVMSFRREPVPPAKSRYQLPTIPYSVPEISEGDSDAYATNGVYLDSTSSADDNGYASTYKWDFGDKLMEGKGSVNAEAAPEPMAVESDKFSNLQKTHLVNTLALVPIIADKTVLGFSSTNNVAVKAPMAKSKSKKEASETANQKKKDLNMADTIADAEESINNKPASPVVISKVYVSMFEGNTVPELRVEPTGSTLNISLTNISGINPLIYRLNGKYYLEIGPKLIYELPKTKTVIYNPKPISDKAIIDAIQN